VTLPRKTGSGNGAGDPGPRLRFYSSVIRMSSTRAPVSSAPKPLHSAKSPASAALESQTSGSSNRKYRGTRGRDIVSNQETIVSNYQTISKATSEAHTSESVKTKKHYRQDRKQQPRGSVSVLKSQSISTNNISDPVQQLKDIFPDWSTEDLQAVLLEVSGDLEHAIQRISDGNVFLWQKTGEPVKKPVNHAKSSYSSRPNSSTTSETMIVLRSQPKSSLKLDLTASKAPEYIKSDYDSKSNHTERPITEVDLATARKSNDSNESISCLKESDSASDISGIDVFLVKASPQIATTQSDYFESPIVQLPDQVSVANPSDESAADISKLKIEDSNCENPSHEYPLKHIDAPVVKMPARLTSRLHTTSTGPKPVAEPFPVVIMPSKPTGRKDVNVNFSTAQPENPRILSNITPTKVSLDFMDNMPSSLNVAPFPPSRYTTTGVEAFLSSPRRAQIDSDIPDLNTIRRPQPISFGKQSSGAPSPQVPSSPSIPPGLISSQNIKYGPNYQSSEASPSISTRHKSDFVSPMTASVSDQASAVRNIAAHEANNGRYSMQQSPLFVTQVVNNTTDQYSGTEQQFSQNDGTHAYPPSHQYYTSDSHVYNSHGYSTASRTNTFNIHGHGQQQYFSRGDLHTPSSHGSHHSRYSSVQSAPHHFQSQQQPYFNTWAASSNGPNSHISPQNLINYDTQHGHSSHHLYPQPDHVTVNSQPGRYSQYQQTSGYYNDQQTYQLQHTNGYGPQYNSRSQSNMKGYSSSTRREDHSGHLPNPQSH
jgi:hypothetical protein